MTPTVLTLPLRRLLACTMTVGQAAPLSAATARGGAIMSVASVGVRLSNDFENLPLFETPPLNGPTEVRIPK